MTLAMFKFGLLLTFIPFTVIFLFIAAWWALVDLSLREISGSRRLLWAFAVLALPLVGVIAYHFVVRPSTSFKKRPELGNDLASNAA